MDKLHNLLATKATTHLLAIQSRIRFVEEDMRNPQPTQQEIEELIAFSDGIAKEAAALAVNFKLQLLHSYGEISDE